MSGPALPSLALELLSRGRVVVHHLRQLIRLSRFELPIAAPA